MIEISEFEFFDSSLWLGTSPKRSFQRIHGTEELIKEMNYYGIKKGIAGHFMSAAYDPIIGNEALRSELIGQECLQANFVLLPPGCRELEKNYLDKSLSQGMVAARLLPKTNRYLFEEWIISPLLKELEIRRIPLFLWLGQVGWKGIFEVCKNYPDLPVVAEGVGHHEFLEARNYFPLMAEFENLYLETHSLISYLALDEVVKRFGAERLIFGTNFPLNDPNVSIMMVTKGDFSLEDKKKIAHGNLEKLISKIKR